MRDITSLRPKIEPAPQSVMKSLKPKPILVISLGQFVANDEVDSISEAIKRTGVEQDYYVLVTFLNTNEPLVDFQVFYEKDFDEVKYEELKKIIKGGLKQ